ncbi:MAG: energy-coupling factor ABC transporter ATP-binding protein [Candidatus Limnocylindria bacterium]
MTEIRLERVSHVYRDGGVRALDEVDLAIARGEAVALVGENGSGKTTLVQHLNGLLRPTTGRVVIDGLDAAKRTVAQLAARVGLAFQDPHRQLFAGRVRAEVEFGPRNLGMRGSRLAAAADAALAAVGLSDRGATNPYDLGLSERKLLAIASVLAMQTDAVVLDEPTAGQDLPGVERVRSVVTTLRDAGRTLVAISHDMEFVAEHFDRVVVMRGGRIALDGSAEIVFGRGSWVTLAESGIEPPAAARLGDELGLGSTPTDAALTAALARRSAAQ